MKTAIAIGCLVGVLGGVTRAAGTAKAPAPEPDLLLAALEDELARSMTLQLPNLERPYFIEYFAWDTRQLEIEASFGAITQVRELVDRPFRADVRVGSYQQDNTGFIGQSSMRSVFGGLGTTLLEEDDYDAMRRDLWLMTDAAYKAALGQLAEKRAYLANKLQAERLDDFARAEPVRALGARLAQAPDAARWKALVRDLSAVFRQHPEIEDSSVRLHAVFATKYLVNSEGTRIREPAVTVSLWVRAATQAPDGMPLKDYVAFYGNGLADLPGEAELTQAARAMAQELADLRRAQVSEPFAGPVLFAPEAAAAFLSQTLAPKLLARRSPLIGIPQIEAMLPREEETPLGRKLLPETLTVVDDPGAVLAARKPLIGAFRFDEEGVRAKPVTLIERGQVKALLASRTPVKDAAHSNGRARRGIPGFNQPQISNLFVKASRPLSQPQLKQKLLALCREQGAKEGLLITKLDDPDITGQGLSMAALMSMASGMGKPKPVPAPLVAFRITPDGKETLVRGLGFGEMTARELKGIVAAGKEPGVYQALRIPGVGSLAIPSLGRLMGRGGPTLMQAPVSVIAPALLFEELELKKSGQDTQKPVILKHPYFDK